MTRESDRVFSHSVTSENVHERIDSFLALQSPDLTRSRIQDLIRKGFVTVNGVQPRPSYRLRQGDTVSLVIPPPKPTHLIPEDIQLDILFEDSSLLVLNKAAGLVVHPAPGHNAGTLVHGLLKHCTDLSGIGGTQRPGIVHRLDKETSGLMVVAKNDAAHVSLAAQFKAGRIKKQYLALVHGMMDGRRGEIDLPIARHPFKRKEMAVVPSKGKNALTQWEKKKSWGRFFTLLSIRLRTGRTHQIRVHMSHMGHPVVGDGVYGHGRAWWKKHIPHADLLKPHVKRHMLHAEILGFKHPVSGTPLEFKADVPEDLQVFIRSLDQFLDSTKNLT